VNPPTAFTGHSEVAATLEELLGKVKLPGGK